MNKWTPTRKVGGAGTVGLALAIVLAWVLKEQGVLMPVEVQAAVGSLISTVVAYLVSDGQR